jgi:hypothetical protein
VPWRRSFTGVAIARAVALVGVLGAGCYDVPMPDCGFACGPSEACPDGYTCGTGDQVCHRDGSLPTMVCSAATGSDGGSRPIDAGADAAPDAP